MVEKGKRKWVRIIHAYILSLLQIIIRVSMRLKKGGKTSKSNLGIVKMHKKYRRQDRDPR